MATGVDIDTNILSDETFDKLCISCKRKDKNSEAEKYCIDCQDYYCLKCVQVHEDIPLLNYHEIIGKDDFQSSTISTLPMPNAPTEQCERHKHKHVDMYCENHDIVGCSTCMTLNHGSCQGRFYISEYIKTNVTSDDIEQELKLIAKSLDENHAYFKQSKQLLLEERSKLLEDIKRFRKEINVKLDELEKATLHEVQNEFDTLIKKAEVQFSVLQNSKEMVKSALNKFGSSSISESQKFVNYKKGKQLEESVDEQIEDISQHKQNLTVEFKPNKEIQSLLETELCLGKIYRKNRQEPLLQTCGKVEQSLRLKTDKGICMFVSACFVEDGTIILSDRGNNNLKRFDDSSLKIMEHYQLAEPPWQVCTVRRKKVAVCLSNIKTVEFISIVNKMAKSNEIRTDFDCYGIAYNCDTLYISDYGKSVYVYNLSGIKLKQFGKDSSGKGLFLDIRSLAVDRSKIYVADLKNGIIILDKVDASGGEVDGPVIKNAPCCSLTATGNLLIYDNGSESVLQFTENGKYVGTVVKPTPFPKSLLNQKTIMCNKQMTHLIIAGCEDHVLVYNLKSGR